MIKSGKILLIEWVCFEYKSYLKIHQYYEKASYTKYYFLKSCDEFEYLRIYSIFSLTDQFESLSRWT